LHGVKVFGANLAQFTMADAFAGGHNVDLARQDLLDRTQAVAVFDLAFD